MAVDRREAESLRASGIAVEVEVGRGASGVVYRGRHLLLDRVVALKRLPGDGFTDPQAARRLDTEIAALVRLEHPSVVRLLDVKTAGAALWLVMEYVEGPTLRAVLTRRRRLAPPDALAVLEQLAAGLDHLAWHSIVHRDLKPENVFVCGAGRCKVGDFGLALMAAARQQAPPGGELPADRVTRPGTILGTPSYLSPEQAEGRQAGRASDIYSLGVIAYELLAGRLPFPGRGNLLAVLAAHAGEHPPAPSSLRSDLGPAIDETLLWALEKDATRRPASAADFWQRLDTAASATWPHWRREADLDALVATSSFIAAGIPVLEGASFPAIFDGTVEEVGAMSSTLSLAAPAGGPTVTEQEPPPTGVIPRSSPVGVRTTSPRRSPARRWMSLTVVFLLAAVGSFFVVHARSGGGPTPPLAVQSVSLSSRLPPGAGSCRSVAIVAVLRLDGHAGTLRYTWTTPAGSSTGHVAVKAGARSMTLEDRLRVASPETVRLRVSTPGDTRATSLPVSARC